MVKKLTENGQLNLLLHLGTILGQGLMFNFAAESFWKLNHTAEACWKLNNVGKFLNIKCIQKLNNAAKSLFMFLYLNDAAESIWRLNDTAESLKFL